MQFRVVSTDERVFVLNDSVAERWELKVYQLYLTLNNDHKPILEAIRQSGQ